MAQKMLESFARLGWRHWGEDGAALLGPKGCAPAAIVHRAGNTWHGYVERGSRHLRYPAPTMLSAIARIEQAEAAGFFSPLWRNASPVPTRLGWEHGVNDGLDYWEAVLQRPGWWILRVELLRDRRYAPAVIPVVSTLSGATSGDYCSSYGLYDSRRPGGLENMVRYSMRSVEEAAEEGARRRYDISEVRLQPYLPHSAAMRVEAHAGNVATVDELVDV
jgi:hypothetical protein